MTLFRINGFKSLNSVCYAKLKVNGNQFFKSTFEPQLIACNSYSARHC